MIFSISAPRRDGDEDVSFNGCGSSNANFISTYSRIGALCKTALEIVDVPYLFENIKLQTHDNTKTTDSPILVDAGLKA